MSRSLSKRIMLNGCCQVALAGLVLGGMAGGVAAQDAKPRIAEQTHLSGVPLADNWRHATLVEDLENPWGLAFVPGTDQVLITERPGRLRLVRDGELIDKPIGGVPEVLAAGQGGLLDIALHPDFGENRFVYLTYSSGTEQANRTTLARGRLNDDATELTDVQVLYEAKPDKPATQHFGSRLAWLGDGTLLMSIGDGGNPPTMIDGMPAREHAQRLDTPYGGIIRLNDDGSIPEDNPFADQEDARPEIFSYGHRNMQGLAVTPDGEIWATEHGPLGGDELNRVEAGKNYGWPFNAYGRDYRSGAPIYPDRQVDDAVEPALVWSPCIAPSGLTVYTGDAFADWKGDLLAGGLLTKDIRRIRVEDGRVTLEETMQLASRVRAVAIGPDGLIYALTDESSGSLIRIEPPGTTITPVNEPPPDQPDPAE